MRFLPKPDAIAEVTKEVVAFPVGAGWLGWESPCRTLMMAAVAGVVRAVATTTHFAIGRPRATLVLTAPLVPLALLGHLIAIPRWGSVGGATVTMVLAIVGL